MALSTQANVASHYGVGLAGPNGLVGSPAARPLRGGAVGFGGFGPPGGRTHNARALSRPVIGSAGAGGSRVAAAPRGGL